MNRQKGHRSGLYPLLSGLLLMVLTLPALGMIGEDEELRLGLLSFRPIAETQQRWQPLVDYLSQTLDQRQLRLIPANYDELQGMLERQELDFVLTNPAHYIRHRHQSGFSGPLATLLVQEHGRVLDSFGGVIITRADNPHIHQLNELQGRSIAAVSQGSLGGYQAQRMLLEKAGVTLRDEQLHFTGMPHDQVVEAVRSGRVEVGFVRTGLLEDMQAAGQLGTGELRVIAAKQNARFPYALSTELFPEWPFVALPHMDRDTIRHIAAALLLFEPDWEMRSQLGIAGFAPAADYEVVEELARHLRLPPYDHEPDFDMKDIWYRYQVPVLLLLVTLGLLLGSLLLLGLFFRRTLLATRRFDQLFEHLPVPVLLLENGRFSGCNPATLKTLGLTHKSELLGKTPVDFSPPSQPDGTATAYRAERIMGELHPTRSTVLEWMHQRPDGSNLLVEVTLIPLETKKRHLVLGVWRDITASRQAERALQESEQRFRALFELSPSSILIHDVRTGQIVDANPRTWQAYGLNSLQALQENEQWLPSPYAFTDALALIQKAAAEGPQEFEWKNQRKNGEIFWEFVRLIPITIDHKLRVMATTIDITPVKKSQQAQQEMVARIRKLSAQLPGMVYQYQLRPDGSFCFPYASEGIRDIYDVYPDEVEKDASAILHILHPDDKAKVLQSIQDSARELSTWQLQYRLLHPQKGMIWVQGHASPEPLDDGSILWHGYISDITERKQAEDALAESECRFRQLTEAIDEVVWLRTADEMLYVNEAYERIWGRPVSYLYSHPNSFLDDVHPDDKERVLNALQGEIEQGVLFDQVYRILRPDYSIRWVHARSYPILNEKGRLTRSAGTAVDITALKEIETELARSNADLEQFAYVTSHDLRQPLRMINSYMQLLDSRLKEQLDDDTREMMRFASDGAKRMDQMLLGLLEYSRVGRKGQPIQMFSSREVLEEALHFLSPQRDECQARIRIEGDWPTIPASRDELSRLLQNVIGNALKYRRPDVAPEIVIDGDISGKHWRCCVQDNGIGVEPSQQHRIFQVFQRLHNRTEYEGNGVGLAVARKIAERHGGDIEVESAGINQGSRFCFTIALDLALDDELPKPDHH